MAKRKRLNRASNYNKPAHINPPILLRLPAMYVSERNTQLKHNMSSKEHHESKSITSKSISKLGRE